MADNVPWNRPYVPKGQNSYTSEEIGWHSEGWTGEGYSRLPRGGMRMLTRVGHISDQGGEFGHGCVRAEYDITPDLWFFDVHFKGDPVMPGCLGVDALWQMLGFFLTWSGGAGIGRALEVGQVRFTGQIWPTARIVTYGIDLVEPPIIAGVSQGMANGWVRVDDKDGLRNPIYVVKGLKVGLFPRKMVSVHAQ